MSEQKALLRYGSAPLVLALTLVGAVGARLAAAAEPAADAAVTAGDERSLAVNGHFPSLTLTTPGHAVVAWIATGAASGEIDAVQGRLLNGDVAGRTFTAATQVEGKLRDARIASDRRGNFAVVWEDRAPEGGGTQARFQLFTAAGEPRGGQQIASPAGARASHPVLAMASDGRFLIAWEQDAGAGLANVVRAATFGTDGHRLAGPRTMEAIGTTANLTGAVAAGPRVATVAWSEVSPCPALPIDPVSAIAAFDWTLRPLAKVDRFSNDNPCILGPMVLAMPTSDLGPLGIFVGRRYSIQRFSPNDGTRVGPRINIADLPYCDDTWYCERVAAVAGDGRGRFALIWEVFQGGGSQNRYDLYAELYGREGKRRVVRFKVNTASSTSAQHPTAALANDGTLLVAWEREGAGVRLRRFQLPR